MNDNPQHLDRRSVQEQGRYALALTRRFGNEDLAEHRTGDAVYFPTVLTGLVVYPVDRAEPLVWITVGGLIAAAFAGWWRRASGTWIAILLVLPAALLIFLVRSVPGVSYALQWPLLAAVLAYALIVTAPRTISFGSRAIALSVLPGPVFLLLAAMLQPLAVALGARAKIPIAAIIVLILIFVAPQLAVIFRRQKSTI